MCIRDRKKSGISEEAIQTHARILPALAKCPSEVMLNRTHQGGDDKDLDKGESETRQAEIGLLTDGI